jgi:hypothetical protein
VWDVPVAQNVFKRYVSYLCPLSLSLSISLAPKRMWYGTIHGEDRKVM